MREIIHFITITSHIGEIFLIESSDLSCYFSLPNRVSKYCTHKKRSTFIIVSKELKVALSNPVLLSL